MKNLSLQCLMCRLNKYFALLLVALCLSGCNQEQPKPDDPKPQTKPQPEKVKPLSDSKQMQSKSITIRGTLLFKNFEGGFWGFDAQDGKKYMPSGLDKSLLKNGIILELTGEIESEMMTFQQYGELFKVTSAKVIDDSQSNQQDNTH